MILQIWVELGQWEILTKITGFVLELKTPANIQCWVLYPGIKLSSNPMLNKSQGIVKAWTEPVRLLENTATTGVSTWRREQQEIWGALEQSHSAGGASVQAESG